MVCGEPYVLQMMKVRNVTSKEDEGGEEGKEGEAACRAHSRFSRWCRPAVTVHIRVSPVAEVLIICVWGRLARFGTTSEWGRRAGGVIFWEAAAGQCLLYMCAWGELPRQRSPSDWLHKNKWV